MVMVEVGTAFVSLIDVFWASWRVQNEGWWKRRRLVNITEVVAIVVHYVTPIFPVDSLLWFVSRENVSSSSWWKHPLQKASE